MNPPKEIGSLEVVSSQFQNPQRRGGRSPRILKLALPNPLNIFHEICIESSQIIAEGQLEFSEALFGCRRKKRFFRRHRLDEFNVLLWLLMNEEISQRPSFRISIDRLPRIAKAMVVEHQRFQRFRGPIVQIFAEAIQSRPIHGADGLPAARIPQVGRFEK